MTQADLPPRRPRIQSEKVYEGLVMDEVVLGQGSSTELRLSPVSIIPKMIHIHILN